MQENHEKPRTELFVRSIPSDVTSERLGEFFSDFAPVKHAVVVMDKETGESKRFGFVAFASLEDAEAAKSEGSKVAIQPGRILDIDIAKPRKRGDEAAVKSTEHEKLKRRPRLLVRNCPWSLRNPDELVKIFSKFGKVTEAYIPRGKNNRMSGFAFVTMKRKKHAMRAVEESKDLQIHGRAVNVSLAVEKSRWLNGDKPAQDEMESESESEDESEGGESEDESSVEKQGASGDEDEELNGEEDDRNDVDESEADSSEEDEISIEDAENAEDVEEDEDLSDTEVAEPKPRRPVSNEHTIFVRNVPYDATAESLKEHFEQFGPVIYAVPVMDKVKNYPKGTAFVAFKDKSVCEACVAKAPEVSASSLLVPDDVDPLYVYEGRVLNITRAVQRDTAEHLAEKKSNERLQALGKAPREKDRRRLFLLNEGRIAPGSRLSEIIPKSEMDIREQSFKLRRQQLSKNPSLHLSMTRLAIRNLPRAMDEKALKALGRKAVVQFATEVREKKRQPLTKEEVIRSVHFQESLGESANSKKHGVVKQSKIIQELKGSGKSGRSRGYGFLEMRNHKAALMALRWLNAHPVSKEEIAAGDNAPEQDKPRRLVVEFAIENAQVIKRQRERQYRAKEKSLKRKADETAEANLEEEARKTAEAEEAKRKGNPAIGRKKFKKQKRSKN